MGWLNDLITQTDWVRVTDVAGLVLGLLYLWLEFKASIWLWLVSVIMPLVHGYTYFARGLYADFGMEAYYVLVAIYGFIIWRFGAKQGAGEKKKEKPITHMPRRLIIPTLVVFLLLWGAIWWVLVSFTDSKVPVLDSFTTSLSMVAMWALAQKWVEQWLLWLVVDAVCCGLYIYKQIPFSATLYGFYTIMAVLGYRNWLRLMRKQQQPTIQESKSLQ